MDGLLVVDKPAGPTSHDVVARVRRALGEPRVGHTGTLDPSAGGVLPLVLGRATRLARFLSASDKSYEAVIRLGVATDTYDAEGVPMGASHHGELPSRAVIEEALDAFRGSFLQQPPAFSAKKVGGKRSHALARARARSLAQRERLEALELREPLEPLEALEPEPLEPLAPLRAVPVTAYSLDVISMDDGTVTLRVDCSAGFYIRSLAHDLGGRLGVGAHLAALRRTRSGDITLAEALPLDVVERDRTRAEAAVIPLSRMLPALSAVVLTPEGVRRAGHGREIRPNDLVKVTGSSSPPTGADWLRLVDEGGELIGLAEPGKTPGLLHPSVVLM